MAFAEEELAQHRPVIEAFLEKRRPPEHLRDQVDLTYRIDDQSIELLEVRPFWKDPQTKIERPFAKTTWVRTQGVWRIFWQRADLKWHTYDPLPEVKELEAFVAEVDADRHACFFG